MPRVVAVRTANGLGHGYSFGNDFYQVWLSSRELLGRRLDPYSPEMTRQIQTGLYGRVLDPNRPGDPVDQRIFPYPAYTDLLFWPTAEIPFPIVRVIVLCISIVLVLATVLMWLHVLDLRPGPQWTVVACLLTMCSYSVLEALFAGQLGLFVSFLLAGSVLALQRKRFLLAGVLLALTTIKPQVTALAIVYLLVWAGHQLRLRRGLLLGLMSTMALLLASSMAVLPHWIGSWIHTVLAYRHYTRPPLLTEVLTSPLGSRFSGPATLILTAISVVVALSLAWRNRACDARSFGFLFPLSTMLAITTFFILPGQAVYDHLILIPAILLLVANRKLFLVNGLSTALTMIGLLVLLWPWLAAFALVVLRPLLTPTVFDSTPVFSLPIRTAASLPFAVLALLFWMSRVRYGKNREAV